MAESMTVAWTTVRAGAATKLKEVANGTNTRTARATRSTLRARSDFASDFTANVTSNFTSMKSSIVSTSWDRRSLRAIKASPTTHGTPQPDGSCHQIATAVVTDVPVNWELIRHHQRR